MPEEGQTPVCDIYTTNASMSQEQDPRDLVPLNRELAHKHLLSEQQILLLT